VEFLINHRNAGLDRFARAGETAGIPLDGQRAGSRGLGLRSES
jgi:hypothetical protein